MKKFLLLLMILTCAISYAQVCFKSPYDFSFQESYNSYPQSQSNIILADFDNDGIKDIVTAGGGSFLLFSQGNLTGKVPANTWASSNIQVDIMDMKDGDFNKDGNMDIAIVGTNGNGIGTFQIAFGNGTSHFAGGTTYTYTSSFNPGNAYLRTGDFNNDSYEDVILSSTSGYNYISCIYLNNTIGGFNLFYNHSPFGEPVDVNHDGNLDLLVGFNFALGLGNGYFDTTNYVKINPNNYPINNILAGINVNDINNDGINDFLLYTGDSIDIVLGNINGTFTSPAQFKHTACGNNTLSLKTCDVNGDGYKDIVCLNTFQIEILINRGNYTFNSVGSLSTTDPAFFINPNFYSSFAVGDCNKDGYDDVLLPGDQLSVILGNPNNNFSPINNRILQTNTYGNPKTVTSGDFNNDGKTDFFCGHSSFNNMNLSAGNNTFNTYTVYANTVPPQTYSYDIDSDGKLDLISGGYDNSTANHYGYLIINKGNGNGTFGNNPTSLTVNPNNTSEYQYDLTIGDFNNDSKPDIITVNEFDISVLLNTGNLTFSNSIIHQTANCIYQYDISSADFNGDGNLDIVCSDWSGTKANLLLGNGNGSFQNPVSINTPIKGYKMCVGDFNGDHKKDFACTNYTVTSVFLGNGDTTFHAPFTVNHPGVDIFSRDLNQDGKDELVVPGSDDISVGCYNGTSFSFSNFYVGTLSSMGSLDFGDFDFDGREDIVVADVNGYAVILYNNSAIIPNSSDSISICNGNTIAISIPGNNQISWNNGSTNNPLIISAPGTYIITSSNFSGSCSSSDTIHVNTSSSASPTVSISASNTVSCFNNSTIHLSGTPTGGVFSGQGVSNTSFNIQQAVIGNNHIYYSYTDTSGCVGTDSLIIFIDKCVWPGDADENLVVDNTDLLPIGIKYGTTGSSRVSTSNTWQGFTCIDWGDTLNNGKNTKYTDCNGSGLIDMNDTLAINLNYNLTHSARYAAPQNIYTTNPDIYVLYNKTQYSPGDTIRADVYIGSNNNLQSNFYGAAFNIQYDNNDVVSGTEKFWFNNSWVGTIDQSKIKFSKLNAGAGTVDASLVRITHTDTSGYGKVATLQFVLSVTTTATAFHTTISNAIKTDSAGNYSNLNTGTDTIVIIQNSTGIKQLSDNSKTLIYPNPASISIQVAGIKQQNEVKVYDVFGRDMRCETLDMRGNTTTLDISALPNGVYFIKTQQGTTKFIKE